MGISGNFSSTMFLPDGTHIASAHSSVIQLWDISGELHSTHEACGDYISSMCFLLDDPHIVFVNGFSKQEWELDDLIYKDVKATSDKDDSEDIGAFSGEDNNENVDTSSTDDNGDIMDTSSDYSYILGYKIQLWNDASNKQMILFTGQGKADGVFIAY